MARGGRAESTPSPSTARTPRESLSPITHGKTCSPLTKIPDEVEHADAEERVSFYVQAADEMLEAVLDKEGFLFTDLELAALNRFKELEYQSRYLFMRLFLRKPNWIRVDDIGYESDIHDVYSCVADLCRRIDLGIPQAGPSTPSPRPKPKHNDSGFIDLTADTDDEEEDEMIALDDKFKSEIEEDYSSLAIDEEVLQQGTTESMLAILSLEELVAVGKLMKVAPTGKKTRGDWTKALLKTTNQSTLNFFTPSVKGKEKRPKKPKGQLGMVYDPAGKKISQSSVVVKHVLKLIGPALRLSPAYIALFDRLSLIYHRTAYAGSQTTTTSLTASLLARFGKRYYPEYKVSRTFSIFQSREQLCEYEAALLIERKIETVLEDSQVARGRLPEEKLAEREKAWKFVIKEFEAIYPRWKKHCKKCDEAAKAETDDKQGLLYYRKRFDPGWPLTRIVATAAGIYARLHDHEKEVEILNALLEQQSFHRGKRGAWYDRLVLVTTRYESPEEADSKAGKTKKSRLMTERIDKALEICLKGLEDPYTHLIYMPSLQRRVNRIESSRKIAKEDRRTFDLVLSRSETRVFMGERLDDGETGRHSVWRSTEADEEGELTKEVGVEALALEHYAKEGWKGFHSENSIMTTIFALIFWDIIFAPIDGVFETRFQAAPLDLSTDAFALVRADAIRKRLHSIRKGKAPNFLAATDDRERTRGTWCVGVNWAYQRDDMLEIIDCIGGESLATVLKMFVEEYGHRTGGLPDLCLWNPETQEILFSEVKGPQDVLSSTQRVWIDVLLGAGIQVELCKVITPEMRQEQEDKKAERKLKAAIKKRASEEQESDDDDD